MILGRHLVSAESGGGGTTLGNGLLACYEFDEVSGSLLDKNGVYHCTNQGCNTQQSGTISGSSAYYFDGASDECYRKGEFLSRLTAYTISSWVYPQHAQTSGYTMIFTKNLSSWFSPYYQVSYRMRNSGSNFKFESFHGSSSNYGGASEDSYAHSKNQWYHFVATWTGSTGFMKLWVNGTVVKFGANRILTGSLRDDSTQLAIIGDDNGYKSNFYPFKGKMDQLVVWNRVLTDSEVLTLNNSNNGMLHQNW